MNNNITSAIVPLIGLSLFFWQALAMANEDLNFKLISSCGRGDAKEFEAPVRSKAGADVNTKNGDEETALMFASYEGYDEIVKMLLAAGVDINAVDQDGDSALPKVSGGGYQMEPHESVAQTLLEAGADVNAREPGGFTRLSSTALEGNYKIAQMLIKAGVDVTAREREG